jgi:hypothetical protein
MGFRCEPIFTWGNKANQFASQAHANHLAARSRLPTIKRYDFQSRLECVWIAILARIP